MGTLKLLALKAWSILDTLDFIGLGEGKKRASHDPDKA